MSVACVLAAALAAGCGGQTPLPPETPASTQRGEVVWERLGEWSGRKSLQTESFTSDTGAFRIIWTTRAAAAAGEGEGTFLLTLHSAISGRPLQVAVDHRGPGGATAYINDDPRVFFAVVDAANIEWSFSVDEAVATRTVPRRP